MTSEPAVLDRAAFARAVRALDWDRILKELTRFAIHRCGRKEMGEDLAQEAIRRLIDAPTSLWDPAREPDPSRLLASTVNGLLRNDRTSARAQRDVPMTTRGRTGDEANDAVTRERVIADPRAFSAEQHAEADLLTRRMALLEARLADAPDALQVLAWTAEGHDTPADLCAVSGWTLERVIAARRRVQRHAAQVARDLEEAPEGAERSGDERAAGGEEEVA